MVLQPLPAWFAEVADDSYEEGMCLIQETPLTHETVGLPPFGSEGGGASGGLGHGRVLCCVLTAHPPWSPPFVAWTANGLIADKPGNDGSVEMISVYL